MRRTHKIDGIDEIMREAGFKRGLYATRPMPAATEVNILIGARVVRVTARDADDLKRRLKELAPLLEGPTPIEAFCER